MSRSVRATLCAALAGLALSGVVAVSDAGADGAPLPPQGPSPAGANDFSCQPPARHPYPVVLVHGTFGNMQVSWNAIVPALKRLGYCGLPLTTETAPCRGSTRWATSRHRRASCRPSPTGS